MRNRSSIFSFETWRGPVSLTVAFPLAGGLLVAARLASGPLRAVPDYDNADYSRFVAVERYRVREDPGSVEVLLLGSSRTQYGLIPRVLGRELGLQEGGVREASVPSGNPWSTREMLRRNLGALPSLRAVVVDVAPIQFNANVLPLRNRFAHLASWRDRWALDNGERAGQVADFVTGHLGIRRSLRSYGLAVLNGRRGTVWGDDDIERLDPMWVAEEDHAYLRDVVFSKNERWLPENFAERSLGSFHWSGFLEDALRECSQILEGRGVPLLVHQPPFHPDFLQAVARDPALRRNYQAYRASVEALASDLVRVVMWDGGEELGIAPADILDYGHFGRRAADVFTRQIARELKPILPPNKSHE